MNPIPETPSRSAADRVLLFLLVLVTGVLAGCGVGTSATNEGSTDNSAVDENLVTILSVFPDTGSLEGGIQVTLSGENFREVDDVTIANRPLTGLSVVNSRTLVGVVPAGSVAGAADVRVTTLNNGEFTEVDGFTYNPAMIVSTILPNSGSFFGGNTVTITGSNFFGVESVTLGGREIAGLTVTGGEVIQGTVPTAVVGGPVDLVISSSSHGTLTLSGAYTYSSGAQIFSITPSSGPQAGGTSVILLGDGFTGVTRVGFGNFDLTNLVITDSTTLRGETPPSLFSGPIDVVVHFADGSSTTLASGFIYNPSMTVTQVLPATGPPTGGTSVVISGTNFIGVTSILFNGRPLVSPQVLNENNITGLTPTASSAGAVDVVVNSSTHGSATLTSGFTYTVPAVTVSQISPSSGPQAGGTAVVLTGTNFLNVSAVRIGSTDLASFTVDSSTQITGTTAASATGGTFDVSVVSSTNGTGTLGSGFTYNETPIPSVVVPAVGSPRGGTEIEIGGSNFVNVTGVMIGGQALSNLGVTSTTTITGVTPAAGSGDVDVVVTSSTNGTGTLTDGYTYAFFEDTVNVSLGAGTLPTGFTAGDFDFDGRLDLAISDFQAGVIVLRGTGSGGFFLSQIFTAGTNPIAIDRGDFNRDGLPDLAVANQGSQDVTILDGIGNGSFLSPVAFNLSATPTGLRVVDFDGGGPTDLAVTDSSGNVQAITGDGFGSLDLPPASTVGLGFVGTDPVAADFDRDGVVDVLAPASANVTLTTLLGTTAGGLTNTVQTVITHTNLGAASGDLDRDGLEDFVAAGDGWATVAYGFGTGDFGTQLALAVGADGRAALVDDFDRDGIRDFVVANFGSGTVSLLRGQGSRSFAAAIDFDVGGGPVALCAVDLDRDGAMDLVVLDASSQEVSFLRNTTPPDSGDFSTTSCFTAGSGPVALGIADFDRDGVPDVVTANQTASTLSLLPGDGSGGFSTGSAMGLTDPPVDLAVGDVNRDGRPDVVLAGRAGRVALLLGNGPGTFDSEALVTTVGPSTSHVDLADFDLDGALDLVVAQEDPAGDFLEIVSGVGDGTFLGGANVASVTGVGGMAVGDLNFDSVPDVVVTETPNHRLQVYLGDGLGGLNVQPTVSLLPQLGPTELALGDLDRDGALDVVVVNASANTLSVFSGNGDGTFRTPPTILNAQAGLSRVIVRDLDFDGDLDIVVSCEGAGGVLIFEGDGAGAFAGARTVLTGATPTGLAMEDLGADGVLDLITALRQSGQVCVTPGIR